MGSALVILVVCVLAVVFGVLILGVSLLETHYLREFVPADSSDLPDPSPYFHAVNQSASEIGLRFCGFFVQQRAKFGSQMYMALWVSPARDTLILVCGGKVAKAPYNKTFLLSRFQSGKMIETSDEFGMVDLCDPTAKQVLLNADLHELYPAHQARLADSGEPATQFDDGNILREYDSIDSSKLERLLKAGLARYRDATRTTWRFTWKGARKNISVSFLRQLMEAQSQKERAKLKRPGSN